jgi:glycosyltransferase involved in cell wall biosynthesis/2-polyprenyl-3-methyl-5-hydroxy-6-metoxy-1,4-benzoquinol methylase
VSSDPAIRYFDGLSDTYASRYAPGGSLWHRHFFGSRLRIAVDWLREVYAGLVVDVGSGPGPLTEPLKRRGVRVVAVDAAPGMAVRAAARGAGAACGDALALPLRDEVADAAVALGLASYVEDLPALLREMARVVRPGGLLVVSVAVTSAPDWGLRRLLRRPAVALGVEGVLTSGLELRTRRADEWRRAAEDAGLALEAERGHDFTLFPVSRLLPGASVHLSGAVERLDARPLDRLASEVVLRMRVPGARRVVPHRGRRPKVARIIARLNVGGPALHTTLLTRALEPAWETVLATGRVAPGELEAGHLLARYDVQPVRIPGLGRAPRLLDDVRAFFALLRLLRRERPDIVHTHTAKAGALGRVAARLAGVPHVVHTFHGHVFHGYFGPLGTRLTIWTERFLARLSDRILAVSDEVAHDVVERYRVAPRERVEVVSIGLPFDERPTATRDRAAARRVFDLADDTPVAAFVGRLVDVKEPQVAMRAWERVRRQRPDAVLLVAGGGPLLLPLRARQDPGVRLLGWRESVAEVFAAADVALLTSRNEGTPVALIEAAAMGRPAVSTRAGGVPSVVRDGETGLLADVGDADALAAALLRLFDDSELRERMGAAAREHVRARWSSRRLASDLDRLYRDLLVSSGNGRGPASV